MRKQLIFSMILVCTLLLSGCGNIKPEKINNKETINEDTQAKTETYQIGDSVKAENLIYTVNSTRTDQGSEFIKPGEGKIYYIVDVTVENTGSESEAVSSLMMFKLFDLDGYNYSVTIGPETKGSVDGEISAGRKLRGELAFEVPEDAKGLELVIEPSLFSSGQIIIELDR